MNDLYTPLKRISLDKLCGKPIMFDANILMVGIEDRVSDPSCSFENMKNLYLIPLFNSFSNMLIHEKVYNELDSECKQLVDSYIGNNINIVYEDNLYGSDPQYTTIFNNISNHDLVKYRRTNSKDCGEVYSLAYASFHGINYFSSKEIMVDNIAQDLKELEEIHIITFDIIVLLALVYYNNQGITTNNKALKSIYKKYCEDVIKRHKLPKTLSGYFLASQNYLKEIIV